MVAVSEKFKTPIPMKSIYRLDNGAVVGVSDVKDLQEGMLYFALNVNESIEDRFQKKKSIENMLEFYEELGAAGMTQVRVDEVMTIFEEQDIKFVHLSGLTDNELKEYGIIKGGVRKTILSVLGL